MKIVIEDEFRPEEVSREDGGSALIWTTKAFPDDPNDDDPNVSHDEGVGVFFRFQSWDWPDQKHELFKQFVGKKVRITIESLDALDQLSEIK